MFYVQGNTPSLGPNLLKIQEKNLSRSFIRVGLIELETRSVTDMWSHLHICPFKSSRIIKKDQKINEMVNFTITCLFLGFGVAQDTRQ